MEDNEFEYPPLNSASQEIRILSITRSSSIEVECHLERISLEENLTYEALSYTWGERTDISSIKLNNHYFKVRKNLAIALHHLRERGTPLRIWVDAVCINQQDEEEKTAQVRQMKKIYEKARKVVIWLGPECDDSSYAINVMNSIDRRWATRTSQPATNRDIPAPAISERAFRAIIQLLRRPWWRRVWIIQEATCASDTYLICGKDHTKFWRAVATVNFITQHTVQHFFQQDSRPLDIRHFHRVIALDQLRLTRRRSGYSSNFLSLLDNARTCEASDPRDKIFALSGLVVDAQGEAGDPNYNIPVDEAYTKFTYALIVSERTLNVFGHCQEAARTPQSWHTFAFLRSSLYPKRPLPSWTPDWTLELEATPFMKNEVLDDALSSKIYKASDDYTPSIKLADDLRTLFVRGLVVDTVSKLGEAFDRLFSPSILGKWHSWTERELGKRYHQKEPTHEAFLRTLVADIHVANGRCLRGSAAPWPITNQQDDADSLKSSSLIHHAVSSRGLFLSKQSYMGLARYDVKKGDKICILHGGQIPFVLRQDGRYHSFKGECYVHGLMDGEGMRYPWVWQDFALR